jgi:hypothetical protein
MTDAARLGAGQSSSSVGIAAHNGTVLLCDPSAQGGRFEES